MRALVLHAPHDLRIENRPDPADAADKVVVRVEAGGICGSDLHYYHAGGFGAVRMVAPMILGHEVAGRVQAAPATSGFVPGDRVAVSPSRPCGACRYCRDALPNHCETMLFYGSAMRVPHVQGAFRDVLAARPEQCHTLPAAISAAEAACAEPLAVALHALARAGSLAGKRVLITGCGPIGALVLLAARADGAADIVVSDVMDVALDRAEALGATAVVNATTGWTAPYAAGKGHFDVMFEASGAEAALRDGLSTVSPRGIVVLLGLGDDILLPRNLALSREMDLRGAFRFHAEFADAVAAIATRRIDVRPILTGTFPLAEAQAAFDLASDRTRSLKIHLDFMT